MKNTQIKKSFVLGVLFVLPLVAYLFFASGVNNFGTLPVLKEAVAELPKNKAGVVLENKITVLGFLGSHLEQRQVNMFNLNQKIYKRFSEFKDFQFVMVLPEGTETQVATVMNTLATIGDVKGWSFVYLSEEALTAYYKTLGSPYPLDKALGLDYVFIVDKSLALRGRNGQDGAKVQYGYDATKVSELTNSMIDDVKIILAAYRMALEKNNKYKEPS